MERTALGLIFTAMLVNVTWSHAAPIAHYPLNGNPQELQGQRHGQLVGDAGFEDVTPAGVIPVPSALAGGASLSLDGAFDKVVYNVQPGDAVSGSFTVAAWINPRERRTNGTLNFFGTRHPDTFGFDVKIHVDKSIRIDVGTGTGFLAITDEPFSYNLNTWYHFAVAVTPTSYAIYLNGNPFDSGSLNGQPLLWDQNHDIAIGAVGDINAPHGEDFHGLIDDVWVFDEAISQQKVRAVMTRLLGDTDLDGDVDIDDLNNVRNNFGAASLGDTNDDDAVNIDDLNNVRNNFDLSIGAPTSVPEPPAVGLLLLTAIGAVLGRRRRVRLDCYNHGW